MYWYGGSIHEAVSQSKKKNAIFVVFIEGDNDLSVEMAATIDDATVLKRLSDENNFLAIKLKSGTQDYMNFAQIYQFVPVPSLFFIGRNGTPLEVVCAGVKAGSLAQRIDKILEEHLKVKQPSQMEASTSSHIIKKQTSSLIQSEAAPEKSAQRKPASEQPESSAAKVAKTEFHEVTKSGKEYEVVCDGDVCVRKPMTDGAGPSGGTSTPTAKEQSPEKPLQLATPESSVNADDKLQQAKVLIEAQKEEMAEKVKEQSPEKPLQSAPAESSVNADAKVQLAKALIEVQNKEKADKEKQQSPEKPLQSAPAESLVDADDKVQRAKALIDAQNKEKADKEKELEKEKEIERRMAGKGVAELKRWQADQELKQIQEERKREKMENNLARQRILEQIAQDRAERKAREAPQPAPPVQQQNVPATSGDGFGGNQARIQFKMPDGSSQTAQFDAGGTLATLRQYVADNLRVSTSSFTLWTAFPRRELVDSESSLRELQLVPSAAILVLSRSTTVAANVSPGAFTALITFFTSIFTSYVLTPTQQVYGWLRSFVFAPRPPPPASRPASRPATRPVSSAATPSAPAALRRRNNIHGLPEDRSGNDDNNTWNGNSTQQM